MELDHAMTDDEDFLELVEIVANRRKKQMYRERPNHFTKWDENEFLQRFRLSKNVVRYLTDKIRHKLVPNSTRNQERNHTLSPEEMVLLTLRFFATGSFLIVTGDFMGVHKSTSSRVVHKVSVAIAELKNEYVHMPQTPEEIQETKQGFYGIAKFPRCIGAVDCTHVKIQSPGGNDAEVYRNRKGYFSLNVQMLCNASMQPTNVVCRWPGSTHDSTIFQNSLLRARLENNEFGHDSLIVGDSGYAVKRFMMTPLANVRSRAESLYNESQIRTRNPIERLFGTWKRRFPILSLGIRLKIDRVEAVIVATTVLQSIALMFNDRNPPVDVELEADANQPEVADVANRLNNVNNVVRNTLINEYFEHL